MKPINFITPLSPHEQRSIAVWYRIASLMVIGMLLIAILLHAWQAHTLLQLRKEYTALSHAMTHCNTSIDCHHQIHKKQEILTKYCQEIATIKQYLHYPLHCLAFIKSCPQGISLLSLSLNETAFNATLHCLTAHDASGYVQQLRALPTIQKVKLICMQPSTLAGNNTLLITLRGVLTDQHAA